MYIVIKQRLLLKAKKNLDGAFKKNFGVKEGISSCLLLVQGLGNEPLARNA